MHFSKATPQDITAIETWLKKDHVKPYFYGVGLETTLKDLSHFVRSEKSIFTHWIALFGEEKFGYLMTSSVRENEERFKKYKTPKGKAITLDLLIGEEKFLGQGLGKQMIEELLDQKFQDVKEVFIDPQVHNKKAIHVYEKVGFKKCEEFQAPWADSNLVLMKLNR